MNDKVVSLYGDSNILVPNESDISFHVGDVIKGAENADLDTVIVLGDKGDELYLSSSLGNLPKIIYLLELAKHKLLSGEYNG